MSDLATPGAAQESHLADAERRKIVVQHEAFERLSFEHIKPLHVLSGAQGSGHQGLRLAAREKGGAVRARQHPHFASDGADLVKSPPVRPPALQQDVVAEVLLLHDLKIMTRRPSLLLVRGRIALEQPFSEFVNPAMAFELRVL